MKTRRGMVELHDHLNLLQDELDLLVADRDNHEIWLEAMEKGLNSREKEAQVLSKIDSISQEIEFMVQASRESFKNAQFPVVCWIEGEQV